MVEMGWPTEEDPYGAHAAVVFYSDLEWIKSPPEGYEPQHARGLRPKIGTVVAHDGGFAMVVPASGPFGDRQPVFSGPHTNYGQPCGGYGCNGSDPYCDDCQEAISAEHDERWAEYYADIMPISRYSSRWGDDDR